MTVEGIFQRVRLGCYQGRTNYVKDEVEGIFRDDVLHLVLAVVNGLVNAQLLEELLVRRPCCGDDMRMPHLHTSHLSAMHTRTKQALCHEPVVNVCDNANLSHLVSTRVYSSETILDAW